MPVYTFNSFDDPVADAGTTQVLGVNDTDQIVGQYQIGSVNHSFLESGGTYTTLDDPAGAMGTFASGINDLGQIVGDYLDADGTRHGFLATPAP